MKINYNEPHLLSCLLPQVLPQFGFDSNSSQKRFLISELGGIGYKLFPNGIEIGNSTGRSSTEYFDLLGEFSNYFREYIDLIEEMLPKLDLNFCSYEKSKSNAFYVFDVLDPEIDNLTNSILFEDNISSLESLESFMSNLQSNRADLDLALGKVLTLEEKLKPFNLASVLSD